MAKYYCSYHDHDGWRYDDDNYLYIFWRKGFGSQVSAFEKLTSSDLIRWYEKIKIMEEKQLKRLEKKRKERNDKQLTNKSSNLKSEETLSPKKLCHNCNNLINESATRCIYCNYDYTLKKIVPKKNDSYMKKYMREK